MAARTKRDWQRWARKGTTTQRGYGYDHQRRLKAALAAWRPGDPCAHCGLPMLYRWLIDGHGRRVSALDLGHNAERTGYVGLAHRACNRADGGRRAQALRKQQANLWQASRSW